MEVLAVVMVTSVVVVTVLLVEEVVAALLVDVALEGTPVAAPPTLTMALLKGANQSFAKITFPASFGCTPSPVSNAVEYPVQQSTTDTGLAAVEIPLAQAGMAALRLSTPGSQVVHPEGFIGVI